MSDNGSSCRDRICRALRTEFESLVDDFITHRQFEYEVISVERLRESRTDQKSPTYVLCVRTNSQRQLLGQTSPYEPGDRIGHYSNYYAGWLACFLQSEFGIERATINISVTPMEPNLKLDHILELEVAIQNRIIEREGEIATTMRRYNMETLVVGGSNEVVGPRPDAVQTLERICSDESFETTLDMFTGSGVFTKVFLDQGATQCDCLDLDLSAARENIPKVHDEATVTYYEEDVFQWQPPRDYDLVVIDPYLDDVRTVIEQQIESLADCTGAILITVGMCHDLYWNDRMASLLRCYFDEIERYDSGETVQLFCH